MSATPARPTGRETMQRYLLDFARHIRSDDANADEFLVEGMSFPDCIALMDHVARAVEQYVERGGGR